MDRRTILKGLAATAVVPALPACPVFDEDAVTYATLREIYRQLHVHVVVVSKPFMAGPGEVNVFIRDDGTVEIS